MLKILSLVFLWTHCRYEKSYQCLTGFISFPENVTHSCFIIYRIHHSEVWKDVVIFQRKIVT